MGSLAYPDVVGADADVAKGEVSEFDGDVAEVLGVELVSVDDGGLLDLCGLVGMKSYFVALEAVVRRCCVELGEELARPWLDVD